MYLQLGRESLHEREPSAAPEILRLGPSPASTVRDDKDQLVLVSSALNRHTTAGVLDRICGGLVNRKHDRIAPARGYVNAREPLGEVVAKLAQARQIRR